MSRMDERLLPLANSLLGEGEAFRGCCVATRVSTFSTAPMVIVVTDSRLIAQQVTRKLEAKGAPLSLPPDAITSASFGDVAGGYSVASILVDAASLKLVIRTKAGEKLSLTMMTGATPFGGGETQRDGVQALVDWVAAHHFGG